MLALVHPFNQPQDGLSRPPSSSSARSRQHSRRQIIPTTSSVPLHSSSRPSSASLHRHSTAAQPPLPPLSVHKNQPHRPASPPPKVIRAPTPTPSPTNPTPTHQSNSFDIHSYPSPDLLRLLATLLTQIAATNDKLEAASPSSPGPDPPPTPTRTSLLSVTEQDAPIWSTLTTASRTALSTPSSTLTFHARNIPTITLEAYLLRILKYCPTTNEVFLSLLVYFDRMSKLSTESTGRTFVIDSYNIHRLVIAGVTVASKFFSDVFYTNSRYAKVGGLPQAELNQLELQFLLLNDFRLVIPGDEMQRYAEQLILFSTSDNAVASASPLSSLSPSAATITGPTCGPSAPMQAMGAIDAYGGRIPGEEAYGPRDKDSLPKPIHHQPIVNGVNHSLVQTQSNGLYISNDQAHHYHSPTSTAPTVRTPNARPQYDTETETETETEAGETDGGETTDDEPTVRPAYSSAGSSSEDNRSLCSVESSSGAEDTGDEGGDEDDGGFGDDEKDGFDDEAEEMDVEGDRTPERRRTKGDRGDLTPETAAGMGVTDADRDHNMASP